MKSFIVFLVIGLSIVLAPVAASTTIDAASTCLTDSTSGKDRKVLVKWIYLAISQHPEINELSAASPKALEDSNMETGKLFTRLIADDCPTQITAMVKEHGPQSISKPFEVLGQVAMEGLMNNSKVNAHIEKLEQFTNQKRINKVMQLESK